MHAVIDDFKPAVAVIDPVSNLVSIGSISEVKLMLTRLMDFLKTYEITTLCTDLTPGGTSAQQTEIGLSSLMDTWILLRSLESDGERNRTMYIAKSRGIAHSDQVREFLLTDEGVELVDVYLGPAGVLTGSARAAREAHDKAQELARRQALERKERELGRKRTLLQAQLAAFQAQFDVEEEELQQAIDQEVGREKSLDDDQRKMARLRRSDET
jgi:circadian clock protein KaiC